MQSERGYGLYPDHPKPTPRKRTQHQTSQSFVAVNSQAPKGVVHVVISVVDGTFNDECSYWLDLRHGQRRVLRHVDERYTDPSKAAHDRYGVGSVMIWSGITTI